jgi:hypothetical protein
MLPCVHRYSFPLFSRSDSSSTSLIHRGRTYKSLAFSSLFDPDQLLSLHDEMDEMPEEAQHWSG